MVIHKQSKRRKSKTVCGYKKINFPNAVTGDWEKVTCLKCKRLMASNEKIFWNFNRKCKHHIYQKELVDGTIKYLNYCTYGELGICSRHTCKMLNEEKNEE